MQIGIIGLGDMGRLYARTFADAGFQVCAADLPQHFESLKKEHALKGIRIYRNGSDVARMADFLIFCVEAERIDEVVAQFAQSIKFGAIVSGQTSVKHPEIAAFEKYLSEDVHIVTCHSLHGPAFETAGQTLLVVRHRATAEVYQQALEVYKALRSTIIEFDDYRVHDRIMADTQAITHMGFESMGSAWKSAGFFPWENPVYGRGIDHVKILTTLRIFSYKSHIYAGLAILNPYARQQVKMYAQAEAELFRLMISEDETGFREKIYAARRFVFQHKAKPLLNHDVINAYGLSDAGHQHKPNSHLSILSMVYAWHQMQINPYSNLICQTPPFKLRLGIAEYLFKNEDMLEESIKTALFDKTIRADDLAFHTAVHEWASIIGYGHMEGYKQHFEEAKTFFAERLAVGLGQSQEMMAKL